MFDYEYEIESLKKRISKLEQPWQLYPSKECIGEAYCTVCQKMITGTCLCMYYSINCPECGKISLVDANKAPERL